MFAELLKRLAGDAPTPLPAGDARLALSALLVRIARSDGDYAHVEVERIERILARRYSLTPALANELRHDAELMEDAAPDTVRFTRAIKQAVPYENREMVVEDAWSVVMADGVRAHEEDALMRLVANLLGVNDRDSNLARQRAAGQLK